MTVVIGSNVASLRTQRRLSDATSKIGQTYERLSSGQRINRASDDAAGLAVSSTLTHNSRLHNRARLNLNDGLSVYNIVDGALSGVSDVLVRMQELAEQAANGTFSRTQRQSLDNEFRALEKEIKRISSTTQFNGLNVLEGNRVTRSANLIVNSSGNQNVAGDGSFIAIVDTGANTVVLQNTINGTKTTIAAPAGTTLNSAATTTHGDLIFTATAGSARDLYKYNYETGETTKLTNSLSNLDASVFRITADGSKIVFTSRTNYVDGGTVNNVSAPGATERLVILDIATGLVRSPTQTFSSGSGNVRITPDGSTAYIADILGLEQYTLDLTNSSSMLQRITSMSGVTVTSTGGLTSEKKLQFFSATNATGQNPSLYTQLFELDLVTGSLSQVSNFSQSYSNLTLNPPGSSTSDGGQVYFISTSNITGQNSSGFRQAFEFYRTTGTIRQISDLTTNYSSLSVSGDGNTLFARTAGNDANWIDISRDTLSFNFQSGINSTGNIQQQFSSLLTALKGVGTHSLSTRRLALTALDTTSRFLSNLNQARSNVGAGMRRLESAEALATSQSVELLAASGRIKDADVAEESALLIRNQILQQAGASLLAQVNQQPALAISLIGGR